MAPTPTLVEGLAAKLAVQAAKVEKSTAAKARAASAPRAPITCDDGKILTLHIRMEDLVLIDEKGKMKGLRSWSTASLVPPTTCT